MLLCIEASQLNDILGQSLPNCDVYVVSVIPGRIQLVSATPSNLTR